MRWELAARNRGALVNPFGYSHEESQRDSGLQPRVARNELPWESGPQTHNPNGVAARWGRRDTIPLGLKTFLMPTQGSSSLVSVFAKVRAVRTVFSVSLSSVRNGGEGRGEEALRNGDPVRVGGAPLSPTLSPFVPHGARETDALLVAAVPALTFATTDNPSLEDTIPLGLQ